MFERLTDRARQVVVLAADEARALGNGWLGSEHLLLGLIREGDGIAARVLADGGVTAHAVRAQLQAGTPLEPGQLPFTPNAKRSLEVALQQAVALGDDALGTEHLLLGLVALDPDEPAHRVLRALGVEPEGLRAGVLALLADGDRDPPPPPPPPAEGAAGTIDRLARAKADAIARQDFDAASRLRELERRLALLLREIREALGES